MPTYEYECEKCGHRFEIVQKMSDASLTQCPKCNMMIHRVLSGGIGISFQGSGFYVTDSKKAAQAIPADQAKEPKKPATEKTPTVPVCPAGCPHCEKAAS
jgi:putative FmdB family regulatory protein